MAWSPRLASDRVAGVVLLAIAVFAVWQNMALPLGSMSEPGAGSVPLILAMALGFAGLLLIVFGGSSPDLAELGWSEGARAVAILIIAAVAIGLFEWLGYRLTVTALLAFLIGVVERRHPIAVVTISIGFAFISYWIFNSLLLVQLPQSPWGI